MERLVKKNINTPEEYDFIYLERSKKKVDSQDSRRWKRLIKYYKNGDLIDLGCLDSGIVDIIPQEKYWGIDVAEKAIENMSIIRRNGHYSVQDLYATEFKDGIFDYAVLGEVIEHLEYPQKAIKEAMRILKPKGILALSTPLDEIKEIGAVDSDRHLWSFKTEDIINLLKPYGKVKISILGSEHFPRYKYHWPTIIAWCWKK